MIQIDGGIAVEIPRSDRALRVKREGDRIPPTIAILVLLSSKIH